MKLSSARPATVVATLILSGCLIPGVASAAGSSRPMPVDGGHRAVHRSVEARRPAVVRPQHPNPLLKETLSGEDEDQGDDEASLAALCQTELGRPNPYRDPSPNVDVIRRDTVAAGGSSAGCSSPQNETTIAVNPENPRNLVAGSNDYRVYNSREDRNDGSGWAYTSTDGGRSWRNIPLPHLTFQTGGTGALAVMDSAGDPAISFGPNNTVYYANIVFSRADPAAGSTESPNGITVNVSHDGGLTWSEPVVVALDGVDPSGTATTTHVFNDKVWVAGDPHTGRVYVTWTRFADTDDGGYLESPIVVAASRDYGRHFSSARRIDTTLTQPTGGLFPYSQGSNPRVGRDGTLYVAYEGTSCVTAACDQPTDRDVTVVATSHDHGRTFRRAVVDTNYDFPYDDDTGSLGLTGESFRINSYPQLAYDERTDRLALTWADDRNGTYAADGTSVRTNGDNIVSTSRGGRRWSEPVVVGTPEDEVFGAVAAARGLVAVTSYTRHYDPAGVRVDYAAWSSRGQVLDRARLRRVTTQSSDPRIQFPGEGLESGKVLQGLFIGDYSAVALGRDLKLHPCWTDFRGRPGVTKANQDVYTASLTLR